MAIYLGSEQADTNLGSAGNDTLQGNGGDDLLKGGGGKDTVEGGEGADYLWGEAGDDSLFGGNGDDRIRGGTGNDFIDGGDGKDTLAYRDIGSDGLVVDIDAGTGIYKGQVDRFVAVEVVEGSQFADTMLGGNAADSLVGKNGNDLMLGGLGHDYLEGGWDQDDLQGASGNDRIYGGLGNDVIRGGTGGDQLYGGEHRDTLYGGKDGDNLVGDGGNDRLGGGHGNDRLTGGLHDDVFRYNLDERLATDDEELDCGRDVVLDFTREADPTTSWDDQLDLTVHAANGAELRGFAAFDTDLDGRIGVGDAGVSLVDYAGPAGTRSSLQLDMGALLKGLGGTDAYLAKAATHMLVLYGVTELAAEDFAALA